MVGEEPTWSECHGVLMKFRDVGYTEEDVCTLLQVKRNFDIELLLTRAGHNIRFTDSDADEWAFLQAARRMILKYNGVIPVRPPRSLHQNCQAIIAQSDARKSPCVIGLSLVYAAESDTPHALSAMTLDMPGNSDNLSRQLEALCTELGTKLGVTDFALNRRMITPW